MVADERMARELAEQRKQEKKDAMSRPVQKVSLDDLFSQIKEGEMKNLNIVVKADVQGSAEAVKISLEKLSNEEVNVRGHPLRSWAPSTRAMSCWPPPPTPSSWASTSAPTPQAKAAAARDKVDIAMYRVIYECIERLRPP